MTAWERAIARHLESSPVGPYLILVASIREVTWARFEHPDHDLVLRVEEWADVDSTPESIANGLAAKAIAALGLQTG